MVCVEGPVGGGKTAFLNAINGSLKRVSGFIHLQDVDDGWFIAMIKLCFIQTFHQMFWYFYSFSSKKGFAYVAQQPWLQHGTMRENIVWGEMFDESRYRKVIWACALHKDIEDLGGDSIDIGENGSALSGGQKARVALARAVYQDKQSMYRNCDFGLKKLRS